MPHIHQHAIFTDMHAYRLFRFLTLLILISLLSACSTTRMLYDNAPWLLRSKVNSYLDLNSLQNDAVEQQIDRLFAWHRKAELPIYATLLDRLANDLTAGLDRAELERFLLGLEQARYRLAQRAIPEMATLFAQLDAEQINHFDTQVRESWDEESALAELPLEERQAKRAQRWIERFSEFYGPLEPEQRQWVQQTIADGPDFQPQRYKQKLQRHVEFISLLHSFPGADAIAARLHWVWDDLDTSLPPAYRSARSASLDATKQLVADADKRMSAPQRERAIQRIRSYRDDFIALAADS